MVIILLSKLKQLIILSCPYSFLQSTRESTLATNLLCIKMNVWCTWARSTTKTTSVKQHLIPVALVGAVFAAIVVVVVRVVVMALGRVVVIGATASSSAGAAIVVALLAVVVAAVVIGELAVAIGVGLVVAVVTGISVSSSVGAVCLPSCRATPIGVGHAAPDDRCT